MRIDWLWIDRFKNLKDLTIDFDQSHLITVLIGRNGTGKSNVLEALTVLFRDLIMGEDGKGKKNFPSFRYQIAYQIKDLWVYIDADPTRPEPYLVKTMQYSQNGPTISQEENFEAVKGDVISRAKLLDVNGVFLPRFMFGYYSGQSERMQEIFSQYLKKYDSDLRKGKNPGFKRMFFAQPVHSNFVLLSFIVNNTELTNRFLQDQLGLDEGGIESVLFVLRKPSWKSNDGDSRFWNARGVVADFLAKLYDISIAPIRLNRTEKVTLWNSKKLEFLYLYVKDLEALQKLAAGKTTADFFQDLESTYVSELIHEIRIRVKLRKNDGSVTFRELSEGEQQLLTVLGLLQFTAAEESLFLLDEPDTHLNPRWSVEYLQHIRNFLQVDDEHQQTSHVLLATHNPIAVAELVKEQIQILKRDEDTLAITATAPEIDPRGMGYAGVMTSEMFDLSAALDTHTQRLLDEQRLLAGKEGLSAKEKKRLLLLTDQLEELGFSYQMRDAVYTEYLRARARNVRQEGDEYTSKIVDDETARRLVDEAMASIKEENEP